MKSAGIAKPFNKTILSGAISAALAVGMAVPITAQADIYEFSYANGGCSVDHSADLPGPPVDHSGDIVTNCTGLGDAWFTMLDSAGKINANTSVPYYSYPGWGYGVRTQMGGKLSFDVSNRVGGATIGGFDFFGGGPAVASAIVMKEVTGGPDGFLWLANMNFDWGGNPTIVTQIVWNATGLFNAIPGLTPATPGDLPGGTVDLASCALSGSGCALPASDGAKKGKYPIGPTPIATSSFNTTGQSGAATVLADLSLGNDDSIGGSPMDNGPFNLFNANFDFGNLTLSGYNDTTPPGISLSTSSINLTVNDLFNASNPTGVTVTCTDAKDGADTIDVNTNANIIFDAPVSDVDTSIAGSYTVVYTCTDNAGRWTAVQDPTNPGTVSVPIVTVPVNNPSTSNADVALRSVTLSVTVVSPGQPVITVDPLTVNQEACTLYTDAGVTGIDGDKTTDVTNLIAKADPDNIIGQVTNNEQTSNIDYTLTTGSGTATPKTRTVIITDTLPPVIPTLTDIIIQATDVPTLVLPPVPAPDVNNCNPGGDATTSDTVNPNVLPGQDSRLSVLRYDASDTATIPNAAVQKSLNVIVERSEPVIRLLDKNGQVVPVGDLNLATGDTYVEYGVNIHDVQDGDVDGVTTSGSSAGTGGNGGTISYNVSGTVDTSTPGNYLVVYTATDSEGNNATDVTRAVTVADASAIGIGNFTMLDPAGVGVGGTNDVVYVWDGSLSNPAGTLDSDGYTVPDDVTSVMTIASNEPFNGFNWVAKTVRVYRGPVKLKFDVTCREADSNASRTICNNPLSDQAANEQYIKMDLAAGEIGGHMTFDWGSKNEPGKPPTPCGLSNCDIDVLLRWEEGDAADPTKGVWNQAGGKLWLEAPYLLKDDQGNLVPPAIDTPWRLVSTDVPENGIPLVDGGVGDGFNGRPMIDGPFNAFHANFNLGPLSAGVVVKPPLTTITPVKAPAFSMGLWSLLAGLFSVFGLRKINNKK